MTDQAHPPPPRGGGRFDPLQILFWASATVGVAAAGVAITAGPSVGQAGAVLLVLLAAVGMVLFFWMSRGAGRMYGAFPERGVIAASALMNANSEFALIDALDEAALVTDAHLSPLTANAAYQGIADQAGVLGESDRPPMMSRLFGADPMLSAPMFRLARAAQAGQTRREILPNTTAIGGKHARFEASVGPMPGGCVLWRLREIGASEGVSDADDAANQLFLDDAPVGFFAARADGSIIYMNRSLRAVIGIGDDPGPVRLKDIIKEDAARVVRRDRRGFGPTRVRVTLKGYDGHETQATALSFWPPEDIDGAARAFVFFAEAETPEAAPTQRPASGGEVEIGVFSHAPFGVAVLDGADPASAAVLDSNTALMDMTQGRATPSTPFAELFEASEGPNALAHRLRQAIDDPIEITLATSPPTAAHVHFARGPDGRGLAYVMNVSQQRELETRLAQSEKMREIGELAAGVAHDFNNLLTVVMQTCSYLLRRHPVGDADYPLLRDISDNATSAKELSDMLRAYARQQTFAREIFNVGDFIGVRNQLIQRVVGSSIRYETQPGRDLPYVKVDKTQLERVLINLATNARDAMTPKGAAAAQGKLTLRTSRVDAEYARGLGHNPIEDGDYVMIEVEDTGSGIKPEHAAKIFRPYHSTKEAGKGTGLGLATSYGIIKQSGGYIFFTTKLGVGTTFRIFLPAYQPTPEELEDIAAKERALLAPPTKDVSGRGRILFVEDLAPVRRATVRNLKDCGYEVEEAGNGEEALDILKAKPGAFDIIISDVSMPVMTGPEMLKEAGADMIGEAKVLFLSGYAPESFSDLLEQFPVHYMSKPVTMEQLVGRVKDLLAA